MKLHTKEILAGAFLFIMGAIVIPTMFCIVAFTYLHKHKPLAEFTTPGQAVVTIEKPGRYYLWNDYQTIFEGTTYSSSPGFPGGLDISLLNQQDGTPVNFIQDQSISSQIGNQCKNSIGYFTVNEPTTYILSVTGTAQPRVCSFGTTIFSLKNIAIFIACFGLTMLNALLGLILIIIGIVTAIKASKQPTPLPETVETTKTNGVNETPETEDTTEITDTNT